MKSSGCSRLWERNWITVRVVAVIRANAKRVALTPFFWKRQLNSQCNNCIYLLFTTWVGKGEGGRGERCNRPRNEPRTRVRVLFPHYQLAFFEDKKKCGNAKQKKMSNIMTAIFFWCFVWLEAQVAQLPSPEVFRIFSFSKEKRNWGLTEFLSFSVGTLRLHAPILHACNYGTNYFRTYVCMPH